MDIWRLLAAITRRWYLFVPLLGATAAAAVAVGGLVSAEYQTTAIVDIAPREAPVAETDADSPGVVNVYSSADYAASVLEHVMNSSAIKQEFADRGMSPNYEVGALPRSSFLGIEVTTDDPDLAIATGRAMIERTGQELVRRQEAAEIPADQYMAIDVLDDADSVAASVDGQLQAMAAMLAAGGVLSLLATVMADDLLLHRARRKNATAAQSSVSTSNEVEGPTSEFDPSNYQSSQHVPTANSRPRG